jgi:VanZ family protein
MLYFRTIWLSLGWIMLSIVWVISLIPVPEPLIIEVNHIDKLEHFVAYFFLMSWFSQIYKKESTRNNYAIGLIIMGIVIEVLQGMGKIRMFDPFDMVANTAGIFVAWYFIKDDLANILLRFERWILH